MPVYIRLTRQLFGYHRLDLFDFKQYIVLLSIIINLLNNIYYFTQIVINKISFEILVMKNYEHKYLKYKNKYTGLQKQINNELSSLSGGRNHALTKASANDNVINDDIVGIENLIIYPQKSFITALIEPSEYMLLPGFVEDSVVFLKNDGTMGKSTISIDKNSMNDLISKNQEILLTLKDNSQIKGTVGSVEPNMITLIDENDNLIMVRNGKMQLCYPQDIQSHY